MTSTTALVVGGTGTMGTRIVRALAARTGTVVRVLTRNPSSERARGLVENTPGDIRPVRGDLDDEQSLKTAFQGVDQVFCNTDFFATASPQQEYAQGLRALHAPQRARLPDGGEGLVFALPLGRAGRWPLIALDDIAFFARHQLDHWDDWGGRTLRIAADALTGDQIAAAFEKATGVPSVYQAVDLDEFSRSLPGIGHDLAAMFAFFQDHDLFSRDRDPQALRALHPELATFGDWLTTTGWDGAAAG
ncbi:NmrA family NAD(P)-binding protein [Streptomyces sp. DASNCL29]|uniref:NmrA family NAD(P)-binding protein n=1 Tax=Streptomyces sp. DASNCL29 TaxID=2583819 RepID=UPI00110FBF21|nr:NmrA family NAD(P)-binding protein [Streptomyces sp. DASNCL29]TMU94203.1 NAD-dependent epimerase/dehydratase family protein [Streptomyces sp. DASNCL29]